MSEKKSNKSLILSIITAVVGTIGLALIFLSGLHLESTNIGTVDYSLIACIFGDGSALTPGVNAGLLTGFIFGVVGALLSFASIKTKGLGFLAFPCFVVSSVLFLCIKPMLNPFENASNIYTFGIGSIIMAISQIGGAVLSLVTPIVSIVENRK